MPLICVRDDITKVRADVIVNSANPEVKYGPGADRAIYMACGVEPLLAARRQIGKMSLGQAAYTLSYGKILDNGVQGIIHVIGPQWKKGDIADFALTSDVVAQCYRNALRLKCPHWSSIAFPVISTGSMGFPKAHGLQIAIAEITDYLLSTPEEKTVYLVAYDRETYVALQRVFPDIDCRIDDAYIEAHWEDQYPLSEKQPVQGKNPDPVNTQLSFAEHLDRLIKARNIEDKQKENDRYYEDASIYRRADITKQTFHKIRTGKSVPNKENTLRIAVALRLNALQMRRLVERAGHVWQEDAPLERCCIDAIRKGFDRFIQVDYPQE